MYFFILYYIYLFFCDLCFNYYSCTGMSIYIFMFLNYSQIYDAISYEIPKVL